MYLNIVNVFSVNDWVATRTLSINKYYHSARGGGSAKNMKYGDLSSPVRHTLRACKGKRVTFIAKSIFKRQLDKGKTTNRSLLESKIVATQAPFVEPDQAISFQNTCGECLLA